MSEKSDCLIYCNTKFISFAQFKRQLSLELSVSFLALMGFFSFWIVEAHKEIIFVLAKYIYFIFTCTKD